MAEGARFAPPPETVTALIAKEESWHSSLSVVGSLEPIQGAVLSAEESGRVEKIAFESGSEVAAGAMLIQLDVGVEEAQLKSAEARLSLARINFDRMTTLSSQKTVAVQELDQAKSQLQQAQGDAELARAMIRRKTIIAPFAGRAGIRQVNLGQFVAQGTALVPLYSINKLYVNFSLPQQEAQLATIGQTIKFTIDAFPQREFEARVQAINPQVDSMTRNVRVQAMLENTDGVLRPGMFAQVSIPLADQHQVVFVPGTSVSYAPYGDSVYVIETLKDPQGKEYSGVRQQFVEMGATRGDQVAITMGVKAGERIVTSGVFKLRPGAAVTVSDSVTPGNDPRPNPPNT